MKIKYKSYWRKTGLKKKWGNIFLNIVSEHKPKNFLEIGVFCGVTARNICRLLADINNHKFNYTGVDLFGDITSEDEKVPNYLKKQKFSNPLKNFIYNFILREKLNSFQSVKKFLNKYSTNVTLIQGNSNLILKKLDLKNIDFIFLDGGHSFDTVYRDLELIYSGVKLNSGAVILCDDYEDASYISGVKKAVDEFVKKRNLKLNIIEQRFAKILL